MIRSISQSDINDVMEIWLNTNIITHGFITEDYWKNNYNDVKVAIQNVEVYAYEFVNVIKDFVGVIDNYIAGLFIKQRFQYMGIGSELLSYLKTLKSSLNLSIYEKNFRAVKFYERHGFITQSMCIDKDTNYIEYKMIWKQ